ncbi:hypothetical protein CN918_25565 [Priestia megaterium]|nr:hypothetical protein CN918_25565 [Priestia megaterium]
MKREINQEISNQLISSEVKKALLEKAEDISKPAQGFFCRATEDINEATHWFTKEDEKNRWDYPVYALCVGVS